MINMLKSHNVPADVGMSFARISHKRTYDLYGQLNQLQAGQALNSNVRLKKSLKTMYSWGNVYWDFSNDRNAEKAIAVQIQWIIVIKNEIVSSQQLGKRFLTSEGMIG